MPTFFFDIPSFQVRIKDVDSNADSLIADSFFVNLMKKWCVPWNSGAAFNGNPATGKFSGSVNFTGNLPYGTANVDNSLTDLHDQATEGKAYMLTVESEKLIAYTLDWKLIDDKNFFLFNLNPDVTDDGNDKIKRLDGGEITNASAGLTWTVTHDNGTITKLTGSTIPNTRSVFRSFPTFLSGTLPYRIYPMLLFRRPDIA